MSSNFYHQNEKLPELQQELIDQQMPHVYDDSSLLQVNNGRGNSSHQYFSKENNSQNLKMMTSSGGMALDSSTTTLSPYDMNQKNNICYQMRQSCTLIGGSQSRANLYPYKTPVPNSDIETCLKNSRRDKALNSKNDNKEKLDNRQQHGKQANQKAHCPNTPISISSKQLLISESVIKTPSRYIDKSKQVFQRQMVTQNPSSISVLNQVNQPTPLKKMTEPCFHDKESNKFSHLDQEVGLNDLNYPGVPSGLISPMNQMQNQQQQDKEYLIQPRFCEQPTFKITSKNPQKTLLSSTLMKVVKTRNQNNLTGLDSSQNFKTDNLQFINLTFDAQTNLLDQNNKKSFLQIVNRQINPYPQKQQIQCNGTGMNQTNYIEKNRDLVDCTQKRRDIRVQERPFSSDQTKHYSEMRKLLLDNRRKTSNQSQIQIGATKTQSKLQFYATQTNLLSCSQMNLQQTTVLNQQNQPPQQKPVRNQQQVPKSAKQNIGNVTNPFLKALSPKTQDYRRNVVKRNNHHSFNDIKKQLQNKIF